MRLCEACRVGHYLRYLPTGSIVVGPEIWTVIGCDARLARSATNVPADIAARYQASYVVKEGRARRYILKHLHRLGVREPSRIGHDLGQLPSCDVVVGAECTVNIAVD